MGVMSKGRVRVVPEWVYGYVCALSLQNISTYEMFPAKWSPRKAREVYAWWMGAMLPGMVDGIACLKLGGRRLWREVLK